MSYEISVGNVGYWSSENRTIQNGLLKLDGQNLIFLLEDEQLLFSFTEDQSLTIGEQIYSDKYNVQIGNEIFHMSKPQHDMLKKHFDMLFVQQPENNSARMIGKVGFWDENKQKLHNGYLKLEGLKYSFEYLGHKLEAKISEGHIINVKLGETECGIPGSFFVYIDTELFTMKKYQYETVKKYFDEINTGINEKRMVYKQNIDNILNELCKNVEILKMIENYYENSPQILFFDIEHLIAFEHLLISNNSIGQFAVKSSELYRKTVIQLLQENNNIDELFSYLNEYSHKYFDMLIKVISKHFNFSCREDAIFVTWNLLNMKAIDYFSKAWNEQYGKLFFNIEELIIEDCVHIYCNIDSIEANNIINAGMFTYFLIKNNKFSSEKSEYIEIIQMISQMIIDELDNQKVNTFEKKLLKKKKQESFAIEDVDLMSGTEFENFIAVLFQKMGYSSEVTKHSGDQGIDVIAEKNGTKIGIQAKCYSGSVGNSAIQEVATGKNHYRLDKAIVVTNNFFTPSAFELAKSNSVILWDRNILKEKIEQAFSVTED